MWIARISIFDEFADFRVSICHNREDAILEATAMKKNFTPQRGVETEEVTIPQALVALGVINTGQMLDMNEDPRLQAPYLKDLLPFATKRAANAIVNAMSTIAAQNRKRIDYDVR